MKVPLKIKIFMWYLKRGVTLTKDNLARRNWNGSKLCSFCSKEETIQHLFFDCHMATLMWRAVQFVLNRPKPSSVNNLFGDWLFGCNQKTKKYDVGRCICIMLGTMAKQE